MFNHQKYEDYHSDRRVSNRLIKKSNFTYINILKVLNSYISKGNLSILDLGSGVGSLSLYMASKNNDVVGIDVSIKAIRVAKESSKIVGLADKIAFVCKKVENINFENKFDLILASEILEHVRNDDFLINKIFLSLKPGGFLIITVPSINAPLFKLGLLGKFENEVGHLRRYSMLSMSDKLFKHRFLIRKTYEYEGLLRNLLFTNKLFNTFVRFLKGPISIFVNYIDNLTVNLTGESQLVFVCQKVRK